MLLKNVAISRVFKSKKKSAMAGNRTRINCLEGNYAHHYTTIARSAKHLLPQLTLNNTGRTARL